MKLWIILSFALLLPAAQGVTLGFDEPFDGEAVVYQALDRPAGIAPGAWFLIFLPPVPEGCRAEVAVGRDANGDGVLEALEMALVFDSETGRPLWFEPEAPFSVSVPALGELRLIPKPGMPLPDWNLAALTIQGETRGNAITARVGVWAPPLLLMLY